MQKIDIQKNLTKAKEKIQIIGLSNLNVDWEFVLTELLNKMNSSPNFTIDILCESSNTLFKSTFLTDTESSEKRLTFSELKFNQDTAVAIIKSFISEHKELKSRINIEIMHLPIPVSVVVIDKKIYADLWLDKPASQLVLIEKRNQWYEKINMYINNYFDTKIGKKFSSMFGEELLELYDHNRIPRGIYPRKSFYDTDYSQLVVWGLIFDRSGKLLIHRRADNAKDNQGMWDKSVGGHVDYRLDIDTARGILREVVEELYEDEGNADKNIARNYWAVSEKNMVYMGDWRPNKRKHHPFHEIKSLSNEWAFFRITEPQHVFSPRTMPDSSIKRLRVISDVYLFVATKSLDDSALEHLQNSEYKLIELDELKSTIDKSLASIATKNFDETNDIPKFTPDLINIMTSSLLHELKQFSLYIKKYISNS